MPELSPGLTLALEQAARDDRIAALVGEGVAKAARWPEHAESYAGRMVRCSIAVSVAIGRAAPVTVVPLTYGTLIATWNGWGPPWHVGKAWAKWAQPGTPARSGRFAREFAEAGTCATLAGYADLVADHLAATPTDLLDGGATVAAWRTYAAALRGESTDRLCALVPGGVQAVAQS